MSRRDRHHPAPITIHTALRPSGLQVDGVEVNQNDPAALRKEGVRIVSLPPGAWWNNIRKAWMTKGSDGEAVLADPQPPPPTLTDLDHERQMALVEQHFEAGLGVPPAVKVTA